MKIVTKHLIIASSAFVVSSAYAFAPAPGHGINTRNAIVADNVPRFMSAEPAEKAEPVVAEVEAEKVVLEEPKEAAEEKPAVVAKKKKPKKKKGHPDGVFSPAVRFASLVMGDTTLIDIRKKVINLHSDTIKSFVDTTGSEFGDAVLRGMFKFADKDGNGTIDEKELAAALQTLGFSWVDEKQAGIIFKRTDKDKSGGIDLDEWMGAAPMTLKTNLIKLAKQNGEDMGLLTAPVKKAEKKDS